MWKLLRSQIWVALFALSAVDESHAAQRVDVELVLALDCSTSVDDAEFDLQKQGLAQAFLHRDVIRAISVAGTKGVAIAVVQWAGAGAQVRAVDWFLVRDAASAQILSYKMATMKRTLRGMTSTAGAIAFSTKEISQNKFDGRRRVIDVSGDGTGNAALSGLQRDAAVAAGITINGLVIFNKEYDLGELANINVARYYLEHVLGGNDAFLMNAQNYQDFQTAIRKKLVREISGQVVTFGAD